MTNIELDGLAYELFTHVKARPVPEEVDGEDLKQFIVNANIEFDDLTCKRWENKTLPRIARNYVVATAEIKFLQMIYNDIIAQTAYCATALGICSSPDTARHRAIKEFFEDPARFDYRVFDFAFCISPLEDIDLAIKLNKRSAIGCLRDIALEVKHV